MRGRFFPEARVFPGAQVWTRPPRQCLSQAPAFVDSDGGPPLGGFKPAEVLGAAHNSDHATYNK